MGMSFLQGLGGVGAGLMTAQQILQKQKESEQRAKTQDLQNQKAQMDIDASVKSNDDEEAIRSTLREAGQKRSGTDADTISANLNREQGFNDDDMKDAGIATTGKPQARYGLKQAHDEAADVALSRGDMKAYEQQKKYATMMDQEGFNRGIQMLDSGASVADVEAEVNKYGTTRFAPGTLKGYDKEKRIITMTDPVTGKDTTVDVNQFERSVLGLQDRAKLAKTEADTEESKQKTNILIPAQALHQEKQAVYLDENARTLAPLRQAQASAAQARADRPQGAGQGGATLRVARTIETADGFVAVMSDGTQRAITGADGKPAKGTTGQKIAATLVGKTISQYGDNGDVAGRVNDMAANLNGQKKPAVTSQHQEYVEAWNRANEIKDASVRAETKRKITERARQNGVVK